MLHKLLVEARLAKSAITLIPLADDRHLDAWNEKELEALSTCEPAATRLQAKGALRLYDSRKMQDTIFDVLAIKPEAAERHHGAPTAQVAGHFRGLRHLRRNPRDAAFRMAGHMAIPAREVVDAYRVLELRDLHANRQLLDGNTGGLPAASRELSQVMRKAGLLAREADLAGLIRRDFLPESS